MSYPAVISGDSSVPLNPQELEADGLIVSHSWANVYCVHMINTQDSAICEGMKRSGSGGVIVDLSVQHDNVMLTGGGMQNVLFVLDIISGVTNTHDVVAIDMIVFEKYRICL